jgi:hypothetical protein
VTTVSPADHPTIRSYVRELVRSVGNTDGVAKLNGVLGGARGGNYSALDWPDWVRILIKSDGELAIRLEDATRKTYVYYTPGEGLFVDGQSKWRGGGGGGPCTGHDLRRWLYGHEYAKPVFRSEVPSLDDGQAAEPTTDEEVPA